MFPITVGRLMAVMPKAGVDLCAAFAGPLNQAFARYDIVTPLRVAMFLANAAHESGELRSLRENLNYRPETLLRMWPKRFNAAEAAEYAHQPERIANRAYADRMGNRDEASGDGWRYRGGGIFQITGMSAYLAASLEIYRDQRLTESPELVEEPDAAALTAAHFWASARCNSLADAGDFDGVCDLINIGHKTKAEGDTNGYVDRCAYFARLQSMNTVV